MDKEEPISQQRRVAANFGLQHRDQHKEMVISGLLDFWVEVMQQKTCIFVLSFYIKNTFGAQNIYNSKNVQLNGFSLDGNDLYFSFW